MELLQVDERAYLRVLWMVGHWDWTTALMGIKIKSKILFIINQKLVFIT